MFDAENILNGLIRGAMGGRRKSWRRTRRAFDGGGLINPRTILAAAGVAWGMLETWQHQRSSQGGTGGAAGSPDRATPPPLPGAAPGQTSSEGGGLPPSILRLMRLMVSAARADGTVGPAERERILAEAREVGAQAEVERELDAPRPLAEIVAGVEDPAFKEQLYSLAFTIVRADESVTGGERIYLAQLAHRLRLDTARVSRLEADVARRIDAASAAQG